MCSSHMEIVLQFSAWLHKVGSYLLTGGSLELLHNMENFSNSYRCSPRVSHRAEGHGCGCGWWTGVRRSSCHCHGGDLGKVPAHLCHTLLPNTCSKANATVMLHEEKWRCTVEKCMLSARNTHFLVVHCFAGGKMFC